MAEADRDMLLRIAAFEHVRRLGEIHDHLTASELKPGFVFDGERIPLINPQRGIFKPQQMRYLLSIKTVFPKPGGKVWYDDQSDVHRQIFEGDDTIEYAFMGQDPALERRYALRAVKQRLHQASFREAVITAYSGRCALSGLPEPLLLDAAHIVPDKDEQLGQPVVPNGIPLSKIHHAAFDAHLIGIDPDRLHVSKRLLGQHDGPMLEALQQLNGGTIHLPGRIKDRPDRDRLAQRFERFKMVA